MDRGKKKQCDDDNNDDNTLSIEQNAVSACMKTDEYTVFGIIRANLPWKNVKVPKMQWSIFNNSLIKRRVKW